MNNQKPNETEQHRPQRQTYEPPKATFVPLRLEERLMGSCNPVRDTTNGCNFGS